MRARDQSSIFSTGGKFRPDYGLLLELHTLTLVARSYVLLTVHMVLISSVSHLAVISRKGLETGSELTRRKRECICQGFLPPVAAVSGETLTLCGT